MKAIEISRLKKSYGKTAAVDGISFDVDEGEFFAFLGQNGAGKSTTINILTTALSFDGGSVNVCGDALGTADDKIRRNIGVVFQDSLLDASLSVRDNIKIRASFYRIPSFKDRFDYLAEELEMKDFLSRRYGTLSGGQRRKADVMRALINTPRVLFLDEPTTGLDPSVRTRVWEMLKKFRVEEKITIFLTTHYMQEAEQADRIGIIEKGKILALDTPQRLKTNYSRDMLRLVKRDANSVAIENHLTKEGIHFVVNSDAVIVKTDTLSALPVLNAVSGYLDSFEVIKGNMDNVFLSVINKEQ